MQIQYDAVDRKLLAPYNWRIMRVRNLQYAAAKKSILMHRLIMQPPKGMIVHHIDGNGLNNCRYNLEVVTQAHNIGLSKNYKRSTASGYRGVFWSKRDSVWRAKICHNYYQQSLGTFRTAEEAAIAWNEAALKIYGPNIQLNVIPKEIE